MTSPTATGRADIGDYALLGDCHSAALVSRRGSIDWLCLPRFDSPACFAALLGTPEHGRWELTPESTVRRATRRYRGETLVLETRYETDDGDVSVIDFMTPRTGEPSLVRIVVGERGRVRMRMELVIRFGYGEVVPWVRRVDGGVRAVAGPDLLALRTPVALHGENLKTVASFTVGANERVPFVLSWFPSHRPGTCDLDADDALATATAHWQEWVSAYHSPVGADGPGGRAGRYDAAVVRSLLTLKALTYRPTGGIVAAPTTSLPEHIGGSRNWDYRYCWLRDATFTLYALHNAGFESEASAWRAWLLRAAAGSPSQLRTLFGLAGERRLPEATLGWLPGFAQSAPVRIGNAASEQLQLDVWGELMDVLYLARRKGLTDEASANDDWQLQVNLLEHLETIWQQPDSGIWEVRGDPRHFTHSKVMVWVAFDRAVKSIERDGLAGPLERWRGVRDAVHALVCDRGLDPARRCFVQHFGGTRLDASLLLLPLVGFLPASDPRILATVAAVEQELLAGGLVRRYLPDPTLDGQASGEGVFLPCSFWLVDNYVLQGRDAEARALFERLLGLCNDVGLLAEEYDPEARRLVGNFPQAFSHVSLINSARNLEADRGPADQRRSH